LVSRQVAGRQGAGLGVRKITRMSKATWQGSLRSAAGAGGFQKERVGVTTRSGKGGVPRSALGDISNRSNGNNGGFGGAGKKGAMKPFSIASQFTVQQQQEEKKRNNNRNVDIPNLHHTEPPAIDRSDVGDLRNPKYCAEYVNQIYDHFKEIEGDCSVFPNYMDKQDDINEKMRALLIDWLIQVHIKFELLPQTLYLTVNLLDRFLSIKVVPRRKLQLVGCTAMLLASKYEEIYAPEMNDFVSMSDKAFSIEELLKMEGVLLNVLDFRLTAPSPYTFLRRYMKVACSSAKTQHFATFLIERSLQEYSMLQYKPSMIAAAALYIAQDKTGEDGVPWTSTLVRHSGYTEDDITDLVETMVNLYSTNQKNYLQAVQKKYASSKYMYVSMINLM